MAKEVKEKQTLDEWAKPHEVDDLTMAFPVNVCGTLLPPMALLPEEFQRERSPWCSFAQRIFFGGGAFPNAKLGIDRRNAVRHLRAVLGSFEPSHEHKIAGAGYLFSQWCEGEPPKAA
jgi:hypothetical protein